jgi:hypothetical protein
MRFSDNGETWSDWEDFSATKSYTMPSEDGLKTIFMELQDTSGNVNTAVITNSIILDTIKPSGTLTINDGANLTNADGVTLKLDDVETGATQMQFSDDNMSWSGWEAYNWTKVYTLSSGNGVKTVYAKLKDAAGNESASFSATITLDMIAPVITLDWYNGTTPTKNDIIVSATTNEGTLNAASHTFTNNGTFDFIATDMAGNVTTQTVTITNIDKIAPITTANITINSTTKYVTINLNATDNGADSVTSYYSVDGVQQTGNLILLNKQGTHHITYWSVDAVGNIETQNSKEVKVEILQMDSNGQFHIGDIVNLIQHGTLQQQDMNGDSIFDREDIRIMLEAITPISN